MATPFDRPARRSYFKAACMLMSALAAAVSAWAAVVMLFR